MTVNFDIFPRQALGPTDFKALGRSIRRWLRLHAKQQGSVHWYDSDSLGDLLRGRPPRSVEVELAGTSVAGSSPEHYAMKSGVGSATLLDQQETAPPPFCMSLVYNRIIDERQVLASVRRALSADLVADVLVNGRTWDDASGA